MLPRLYFSRTFFFFLKCLCCCCVFQFGLWRMKLGKQKPKSEFMSTNWGSEREAYRWNEDSHFPNYLLERLFFSSTPCVVSWSRRKVKKGKKKSKSIFFSTLLFSMLLFSSVLAFCCFFFSPAVRLTGYILCYFSFFFFFWSQHTPASLFTFDQYVVGLDYFFFLLLIVCILSFALWCLLLPSEKKNNYYYLLLHSPIKTGSKMITTPCAWFL